MDTVLPSAAAKSISMSTRFDHDDVRIAADPDRLQQVIWNLVSNAIKFTPAGGTIDVSLSRVSGQLLVTVQDSGQGIDPAFLPYVFDRFRQGRSGLGGRSQPSLGLGLAIARHLVELHGGTLQAESKGVGLGATFTVALPIAALLERTGPAASGSALAVRTASLQNLTVLVVDDDADARQSLKILLESCGARVIVCAGARAALEAIEAQSPDVLVSDVGMPEMDGYALIAARRGHESARGAPVLPAVALTAYGRPEDRLRALEAGFNAHLTKPVEPEELAAVIRTTVRK
jgi:CheY-like chemotaxis protein